MPAAATATSCHRSVDDGRDGVIDGVAPGEKPGDLCKFVVGHGRSRHCQELSWRDAPQILRVEGGFNGGVTVYTWPGLDLWLHWIGLEHPGPMPRMSTVSTLARFLYDRFRLRVTLNT